MRLDKYLKVSRLIKRRTLANEVADAGRVLVNGKPAKASYAVKVGDLLRLPQCTEVYSKHALDLIFGHTLYFKPLIADSLVDAVYFLQHLRIVQIAKMRGEQELPCIADLNLCLIEPGEIFHQNRFDFGISFLNDALLQKMLVIVKTLCNVQTADL